MLLLLHSEKNSWVLKKIIIEAQSIKDISNCLIEKHDYDYNSITMYIDNCYMPCDEFIKKYFSNERAEIKSFIKKTYNRKVTIEDIKELCKELFD